MFIMKKFVVIFVVSFLVAENLPVLTIGGHDFFSHDFYSRVPKKQWVLADSLQKNKLFMLDTVNQERVIQPDQIEVGRRYLVALNYELGNVTIES